MKITLEKRDTQELDAALEPILLQQKFKQGGQDMIRLGDNTVPYNEQFRLLLITKLPNPEYAPEVQASAPPNCMDGGAIAHPRFRALPQIRLGVCGDRGKGQVAFFFFRSARRVDCSDTRGDNHRRNFLVKRCRRSRVSTPSHRAQEVGAPQANFGASDSDPLSSPNQ